MPLLRLSSVNHLTGQPPINAANIPKYASQFSKKVYIQHQLPALLLLKEYLKCGHRELTEIIELSEILQNNSC